MTREEYEKTYIRMMDSVRTFWKGDRSCKGVDCTICPLRPVCIDHITTFAAFAIAETVEKWAKDHPLVTYAYKYKEVFGIDPNDSCPARCLGLLSQEECNRYDCEDCKRKYWNLEYVEPKKEGE